jgi:dsRNA-specific ribonuclease
VNNANSPNVQNSSQQSSYADKLKSKKLTPVSPPLQPQQPVHQLHHDSMTNDDLMPYVLNEYNRYITIQYINVTLQKYGANHKVKDLRLFQIAVTHSSYMIRDLRQDRLQKLVKEKDLKPIPNTLMASAIPLQKESYERLEFLGDSVIHMILADYLTDRFTDQQEGFLTKLRTKVENGKILSKFSKALGLNNYLLIARNIELIGGRENNLSVIEDIFEAFMGALFLDSNKNYSMCYNFVVRLLEEVVDISTMIHVETNFKDLLLQYYHQMRWPDPEYGLVSTRDEGNKKYFTMCVRGIVTNRHGENEWIPIGEGTGTSKRKGEQEAAKTALIRFGQIKENVDNELYEEVYAEDDLTYS